MDFVMASDIFAAIQDCECEGEAPPVFTLPPPPPPPGFHYLQDPEDAPAGSSLLPLTCPVLVDDPQHYADALFSTVAASCVLALLMVLVIIVTIASRRRSPRPSSLPSRTYRAPPPPAIKPAPRTPSHVSYASLEPSFAVEYFSTPLKAAGCHSPSYCTPCPPSPSHPFHSSLSPYSSLASSPSSPCSPSFSPLVVRYHSSGQACSMARPHTFARTQPAHPRRSPLYRPRLAKVVSGQLLMLPAAEASPCLHPSPLVLSPVSPSPRAVGNVYSPLPASSAQTAFVFP